MASTYGSGLRARLLLQSQKAFGQRGFYQSEDEAEKKFLIKLYGSSKKPEVCEGCNYAKAANGSCSC